MALEDEYPATLVGVLRRHFAGGPFQVRAHELAIEAGADPGVVDDLLSRLAREGLLRADRQWLCPCDDKEVLSQDEASQDVCARCNRAFEADVGGRPSCQVLYIREAARTRDVEWLLALHGMNTTGAWQEAFNWLVSRSYGHAVPVAIYKYGIVRPGAIIKWRQQMLVEQLQQRLLRLSGETAGSGFGRIPDVVAHSFGTWLLGHALTSDQNLKVGRVILTGCILRPDFDWAALISRGQVQAVLCHVAGRDGWARVAHYIIPDSGPSGVQGFNDRKNVGHAFLTDGAHSDFFLDEQMPTLFQNVWQPFLTAGSGSQVRTDNSLPPASWKEACWPFRATILRYAVLSLAALVLLAGLSAFVLGLVDLWQIFR